MPQVSCCCQKRAPKIQTATPQPRTSKCDKVIRVVSFIFTCIIAAALFSVSATFFAVGFLVGIVFEKQTRETIDKIKKIWERQPFIITALFVVGAILAVQVTIAAAAFMYAAHIGSKLAKNIEEPSKS